MEEEKKDHCKAQGADSFVLEHPRRSFQTSVLHQDRQAHPTFKEASLYGSPGSSWKFSHKKV